MGLPRLAGWREHVDDHQLAICRKLEEMGKVVLLEQPDNLLEAVTQAMALPRAGYARTGNSQMLGLVAAALKAVAEEKA